MLREHVTTVVRHYADEYPGVVTHDAINSGAAMAPGATADRSSCDDIPKCVGVRQMIGGLSAGGTPIDGIGLQSRLLSPEPADLASFSTWIGDTPRR